MDNEIIEIIIVVFIYALFWFILPFISMIMKDRKRYAKQVSKNKNNIKKSRKYIAILAILLALVVIIPLAFTKKQYTVTFYENTDIYFARNSNGGQTKYTRDSLSYTYMTCTTEDYIDVPERPTPSNVVDAYNSWEFEGWYTEPECTNRFSFYEKINKDIKLYAKWIDKDPLSNIKVWITSYGSKYHRKAKCGNSQYSHKITKKEAIRQGYEPCQKCYK